MMITLSKDLEQFVHDAVRSGLYAREDDVIRDALDRLKRTMPKEKQSPGKGAKPSRQKKEPLTPDELNQLLLASGLITQLPNPAEDVEDDADDLPIVIQGEPLSETIIRERR